MNRKLNRSAFALVALLAITAACGKKDKPADDDEAVNPKGVDKVAYQKRQQAFVDSVLGTAPKASQVAEKLGKKYDVGSTMMRDTIAVLAKDAKTGCFEKGKAINPYLAGVASFWVNLSPAGSDVIRVQESKWSSDAGALVDACLNDAAKQWKLSTALGKPGAYIVQIEFR
jgi:hypothetical protein